MFGRFVGGSPLDGGEEGFQVAVDIGKDLVQGFACAGPDGTVLIVYSDPRAWRTPRSSRDC